MIAVEVTVRRWAKHPPKTPKGFASWRHVLTCNVDTECRLSALVGVREMAHARYPGAEIIGLKILEAP